MMVSGEESALLSSDLDSASRTHLEGRFCPFLSLLHFQGHSTAFHAYSFHSLLNFFRQAINQIIHSIGAFAQSDPIVALETQEGFSS
jgi:hypothetical protein